MGGAEMIFPFFYAGKIVEIIRFTACKNLRDSLYCWHLSCDSQPMGLMWRSIEHERKISLPSLLLYRNCYSIPN